MAAGDFPVSDGDTIDSEDPMKGCYGIYPTSIEQETLSVTSTTGSVSYSAEQKTHIIKNIGTTTCYINFDAAATTSDWKLKGGETLSINGNATAIHAITSSGTTTLRIMGMI